MNVLRRIFRQFGFEIKKIPDTDDTSLYIDLFGEHAVRIKNFYNIGAGSFSHPCWRNVDLAASSPDAIAFDMMKDQPMPIESNSAELFYTSHTIEHVTNRAVLHLFKEVFRCLKPGGVFRVITPNILLGYQAWKKNDRHFFYWVNDHDQSGEWKNTNLKMPLSKATLTQVFLEDFASTASEITVVGAAERISDSEFKHVFDSMKLEDALDYCIARCPVELQARFPFHHMNWFHHDKLLTMLQQAGFKYVFPSAYGQSLSPVLRNLNYFDQTLPKTSLYMEAVK